MSSFLDTRFPEDISFGSSGGPKYNTAITIPSSGIESRNIQWTYPSHEYDVATGVDDMSNLEDLIAFFHITMGKAYTFRYKDFADFQSCKTGETIANTDQSLGDGDGSEVDFQIWKTYSYSSYSKVRKITKPVSGTVVCALDGTPTSAFSVNTNTGIITFDSAPGNGVAITVGYEFDVPCRFDTDTLSTNLEDYQLGSIEVPIVEVKS